MKSERLNTWRQSTQWRMISREAIKRWNAKRDTLPKCGAKRKRDGEPCQQLAKENGRCFFHGGRTGKGADYHRHLFPNGDAPNAEVKLQRKLQQIERDKKAQAKRRAEMSPEQRARHKHWHKTHQPGPAAARARGREDRKRSAEIRASLNGDEPKPASPELAELREKAKALEAARDYYRRVAEKRRGEEDRGVFD